MKNLEQEMLKIIKLLKKLDFINMSINAYVGNDYDGFAQFIPGSYIVNVKESYPVKFIYHGKKTYDKNANLNIEFSAIQSNEDYVKIVKDKMLSHKILKIEFHINDWVKMKDAYVEILVPWFKSRQKKVTYDNNEWVMCIPPEKNDINYKKHMKQYLEFCKENPDFFK